jgi:hypothetical protein|tara:strand:+ start:756 stop:1745 length:990 start_codon:yes stop_codon:yes gene_type:complete
MKRKIRKYRGGGMDASKADFKVSSSPFSAGYKGAKATSTVNRTGPGGNNKTTTTVTGGGGGGNGSPVSKAKKFVQNVGYQTKQLATKYLGLDKKPKTKNLNDYRVTTREIGIMNRNKTGIDRKLSTAKDIQEAFELQGAYETRRNIKGMLPSGTKAVASIISPALEKNTIRNRKFFEKSVLGTDKKGSLYSDKSFTGLGVEKRNEMYKKYAKDRMDRKIDAFGRPIPQGRGDGGAQAKCPDGTFPPCIKTPPVTAVPKTSAAPTKFFDFQAYNSGGVSSGPPPKRGPNPQVPPVKMKKGKINNMTCPHRPDGIRGMGAAIKGSKFIGVK